MEAQVQGNHIILGGRKFEIMCSDCVNKPIAPWYHSVEQYQVNLPNPGESSDTSDSKSMLPH